MKIVSINNLKPGMVISEDVFSYHGQCLAKQNTPVTLQLIEHLKFYQIASVSIWKLIPNVSAEARNFKDLKQIIQKKFPL